LGLTARAGSSPAIGRKILQEEYEMDEKPLYVPIILGTARQGRQSEHVANFLLSEMKKRPELETELIDVRQLKMTLDDAGEEMKDPEYAKKMARADGVAIVTPEYNHGYPGLLKHALDMCLEEYIHKAVGLVGVSAGPFGGSRVIEQMVQVVRELGLAVTFTDVNFSRVRDAFDEKGNLKDEKYVGRVAKFLNELVWMSRVLRYGRENIPPL
jgi:NAD(P)H-dependent FMN reductase